MSDEPEDNRASRLRIRITSSFALVGLIYIGSLIGYWLIGGSSPALAPVDTTPAQNPAVSVYISDIDTGANELDVKVLLIPPADLVDPQLGVLDTDVVVRLYPWVDIGEIVFEQGQTPATVKATIEAAGDPDNWPFDTYRTAPIHADAIVGTDAGGRTVVPAEVRFSGGITNWDVRAERSDAAPEGQIVTLQRNRGTLAFDLGVILVLVALPALALFVAIETVTGKRQFLPPLTTWFAAMLFAVVPLRNFLPGAPPPGAWIDQAVVLWVLIALVSAMGLYIVSWFRQSQ
ncbi:MAG: DUF4436 domain-containing protein [Actinomycetota bacterium]|nr:DUF4436 domain-containing protein [Actinomycetota bacterium]